MKRKYKYIYGPVNSWRLGRSLGIDPLLPKGKVCGFDCIYCQVGRKKPVGFTRRNFVPTDKIADELKSFPDVKIDYITFSGAGEPTLAKNLGALIKEAGHIRKEKIAVLTNATLLGRKDIQKELKTADLVEVKLDASSKALLKRVNRPFRSLTFSGLIKGIKAFRRTYKGRLALQIMFVKDNIGAAESIARIARAIRPEVVHINTPLRPSGAKAVSKKELDAVKPYFKGLRCISVYDAKKKKKVKPVSRKETLRRRGKPV